MMQPADSILRKDAPRGCGANSVVGGSLPQSKVRAVFVVTANVFREHTFQMVLIHHNKMIQHVSSAAFNPIPSTLPHHRASGKPKSRLKSSLCLAIIQSASRDVHSRRDLPA